MPGIKTDPGFSYIVIYYIIKSRSLLYDIKTKTMRRRWLTERGTSRYFEDNVVIRPSFVITRLLSGTRR